VTVAYRHLQLPRRLFTDANLAGVGFLRELGDYGVQIEREPDGAVISLPNGLRFEAREDRFIDTLCMLVERFVAEEYAWLEVGGHVVIDVGANIADSVLYFAHRGAVHVYGYEPDAAAYAAAARNVTLNNVENVSVTEAAVVGRAQAGGEPSVTFAAVLGVAAREHPGVPIVCKIDCEGCEYEILAPESLMGAALEDVRQLMIEYHWRSPQPLRKVLEQIGFEVEAATGPPGVGWIRARRPTGALPRT
jgi:Methyltransferase FkbM domain